MFSFRNREQFLANRHQCAFCAHLQTSFDLKVPRKTETVCASYAWKVHQTLMDFHFTYRGSYECCCSFDCALGFPGEGPDQLSLTTFVAANIGSLKNESDVEKT